MLTQLKTKFDCKNKPKFESVHTAEEYLVIKYLGYAGMIAGVFVLWHHDPLVGLMMIFCSCIYLLFFFLAKKQTKLDTENKTITTRHGFRVVQSIHYQEIIKLYILAKEVTQKLNARGSNMTLAYTLYQGFVLTEDQPYLLIESKNKKRVNARLERVADAINIEISDLT